MGNGEETRFRIRDPKFGAKRFNGPACSSESAPWNLTKVTGWHDTLDSAHRSPRRVRFQLESSIDR